MFPTFAGYTFGAFRHIDHNPHSEKGSALVAFLTNVTKWERPFGKSGHSNTKHHSRLQDKRNRNAFLGHCLKLGTIDYNAVSFQVQIDTKTVRSDHVISGRFPGPCAIAICAFRFLAFEAGAFLAWYIKEERRLVSSKATGVHQLNGQGVLRYRENGSSFRNLD